MMDWPFPDTPMIPPTPEDRALVEAILGYDPYEYEGVAITPAMLDTFEKARQLREEPDYEWGSLDELHPWTDED